MHPYQEPEKCEKSHELVAAAARGDMESVENLLKAGVDPDQRGVYREAALHWTAAHGDYDMVQRLVDAGAYATAANNFGETPGWVARDFHHLELAEQLDDRAKRESSSFRAKPRSSHEDRIRRPGDAGRAR